MQNNVAKYRFLLIKCKGGRGLEARDCREPIYIHLPLLLFINWSIKNIALFLLLNKKKKLHGQILKHNDKCHSNDKFTLKVHLRFEFVRLIFKYHFKSVSETYCLRKYKFTTYKMHNFVPMNIDS